MPVTAIHKARQYLQELMGVAELEISEKPATQEKILRAVRAVDRLLVHIEELAKTCPAQENCPNSKRYEL